MVINQDEDVESLSTEKDKQKSDEFGVWVKLKIPKEEGIDSGGQKIGFEDKDQMNQHSDDDTKRVCHVCRKAFSSGKALGGHMRIHAPLPSKKDLIFKKKFKVRQTIMFKNQNPREEKVIDFVKKKKKTTTTTVVKKPICMICGKGFPSMKSLFGHMRCHPERDWRGIHPPSKNNTSSSHSSSLSDAEPPEADDRMGVLASGNENRALDLTQSLMRWPVTAKRGRKAVAAGSSSELSSSEDDQLRDAVNYLMMLSQGDSPESGVTQRQNLGEPEAANSCREAEILGINRVSKMRMTDQSPVEQRAYEQRGSNEVGKAVAAGSDLVHGESVDKLGADHEHNYLEDGDDDDGQMDSKQTAGKQDLESGHSRVVIKNKKRRKKRKLCDLNIWENASPVDHKVVEENDKYRCNTCDKSFPTHQALGGHRSSHNKFSTILHKSKRGMSFDRKYSTSQAPEGPKWSCGSGLVEAPSSSETSQMCHKVLDFDLNEVPDEAGFESELAWSW